MRNPSMKWRQQFTLDLPAPQPGSVWLHACSVGEVSSVTPLIRALIQQGHKVHLTVVTATGFAHAERLLKHDISANTTSVTFLPWDFPTAMSRMISKLKPALLLLAETEFWPGMLAACRKQQIPVIGINTRISDRSFPRYRATSWLWKRWLAPVNLFLAQSDTDQNRLIALGIDASHVEVVGNLKYAISAPNVDATALRLQLDATRSRPILVIASTHEGEDARLLDMWPAWHAVCPELLTVIVPRHPERFDQVADLIRERGISLTRWSEPGSAETHNDVVLLDAMGLLTDLYSVADAVIIAGSLQNIGGHNPLEAAICGRGIVSGPYVQNFRDIMADMQLAEAAIICSDDQELEQAICRLLTYPHELRNLHANAALFIEDRSHVLDRMLDAIKPYLPTTDQPDEVLQPDV